MYLDTSAVVKLYTEEVGSLDVDRVISDAKTLATSVITYVETRSALTRKHRIAEFDTATFNRHKRNFETDWNRFERLAIDLATIRRAGELTEQFGLKAHDAMHLASAEGFRAAAGSSVTFVCFDNALNRAAAQLGMNLIDSV